MQNDLLIRAAKGQEVERIPVWVMRQAGRILPEYRAVRKQSGSFINLVKNPELVAEVTLQPVDLLGVDAAIIFSDILVIPEAMGLPYQMDEGIGPRFEQVIRSAQDMHEIHVADPSDLAYVADAIRLVRKQLNGRVPLIGFAGAPWTIFCYMIEGKGSKTFSNARKMLYTDPGLSHRLLKMITDSTIAYLKMQIEAGAQLVQVFDSWAAVLGEEQYASFSIRYMHEICSAITEVPVIIFGKGANNSLHALSNTGAAVLGIDWTISPAEARQALEKKLTLQGNLDPACLYAPDEVLVAETLRMLKRFGRSRTIANLGHGVYPDTDKNKVKLFIDTVKSY